MSGRLIYCEEDVDSDKDIQDDKRAMLNFQQVRNSIFKSIQLKIEIHSNHADKKMPILDMKVWIEKINEICLSSISKSFLAKNVPKSASVFCSYFESDASYFPIFLTKHWLY